ncbi:uncharacterized protein LOC110463003 [Mizuhopecten yessoensis]|uniref:DUF229 domain containing protein n=1 Tax=Mizuhopecten yessoensis TaxID=6573 RepID=A0A210PX67_MIZYE|nr:uncharacterized protein LOC110463003 [Mizuhopecten yessoensis]XP_021372986.1 uncharacterized protein LOC110463003 [Mizuhopecten yessoensis]XP_021372987.1 uncharacterized protein LOC110463003 [Mizuhopecten yessoensis]XP_021372988.1 uncharacterized protein LOC110463003 [Mizuhopecten yessoensis]OWF41052.1 hypothetical protein KP79_PYT17104 [Mizuhopecten yessoensis]
MTHSSSNGYIFLEIPYIILQTCYIIWVFICDSMRSIITGNRKSQKQNRKLILLAVSTLFVMYMMSKYTLTPRFTFTNENVYGKCIIPNLNPFDESIKKFEWHPNKIKCDDNPTLVFVNDDGFLQYNESAVRQQHLVGVTCVYSVVSRQKGNDDYVDFGPEVKLKEPTRVTGDYFRVKCKDSSSRNVYDVMHYQIDSKTVKETRKIQSESDDKFSILILGVDAVSRLAAIRKLPKTFAYLRDEMKAFEFKGHMKVADNTFPNVVPMLTGKKAYSNELPSKDVTSVKFDSYPFVWYALAAAGYATLYSEDYADINMFNLGKAGFDRQPTDHYMRPYWRGIKKIDLLGTLINSALMGFEDQKMGLKKTSTLCYGNTPKHVLSLNHAKEFIKRYSHKLRFSFTWLNEISHDYVNFLELGDDDFKTFFQWINENGHFDNSFVVFLSDHGSRIDSIRNTYVGRIEERMPLLQIAVPRKLRDRYPSLVQNMEDNTQRLTTHFDFHETLLDIMNSKFDSSSEKPALARGISLFSPIPESRSCAQAGVPEHYCACYGSEEISVTLPVINRIATFVVDEINLLLGVHNDLCEKLSLKQIKHAEKIELGLKANGDVEFFSFRQFFEEPEKQKEERYLVLIETIPGNALLEATVLVDNHKRFRLLGEVSRTNKYGKQSHCVKEDALRLYCLCKQPPP